MTLRLRNILLVALSSISAIGTVFIIFSFFIKLTTENTMPSSILALMIISLFSTIFCFATYYSFRNTTSFEIFFYFLFVFSIFFDIFRITEVFKLTEGFWTLYPMLGTRLTYYGRFVGTLSLLCAGLFATGLEYQRIGNIAIVVMFIPIILVIIMPIDISTVIIGGTYQIGGFREIFATIFFLNILAILNFIIAGFKNENNDYFLISIFLFISICGRELYFYSNQLLYNICGLFLLTTGAVLFSKRIHKLYLWY